MSNGSAAGSAEKEPRPPDRAAFKEGVHFYYENGYMVLTSKFLIERGYCCGNGCRHCPFPEDERNRQSR